MPTSCQWCHDSRCACAVGREACAPTRPDRDPSHRPLPAHATRAHAAGRPRPQAHALVAGAAHARIEAPATPKTTTPSTDRAGRWWRLTAARAGLAVLIASNGSMTRLKHIYNFPLNFLLSLHFSIRPTTTDERRRTTDNGRQTDNNEQQHACTHDCGSRPHAMPQCGRGDGGSDVWLNDEAQTHNIIFS